MRNSNLHMTQVGMGDDGRSRWRLLAHHRSEEIFTLIEEIGFASYESLCALSDCATSGDEIAASLNLSSGWAGFNLLSTDLALIHHGPWFERGNKALTQAVSGVPRLSPRLGLFEGVAGVAYSVEYLRARISLEGEETNASFDELLIESLLQHGSRKWDLGHGLVGVGVYALTRMQSNRAPDLLKVVFTELERTAERHEWGLSWPTHQWGETRYLDQSRLFGLGTAHGNGGVIGLAASALRIGYSPPIVLPLLEGAVAFVRHHLATNPEGAKRNTPGWCWGNLGIALQLIYAGQAAKRNDWEELGTQLALEDAAANHNPSDACLCHGTAGMLHMFNRLWQTTGNNAFRVTALHWLDALVNQRLDTGGVAGFEFLLPPAAGGAAFGRVPGMLQGAVGVALALLATVSPVAPAWDSCLLMSPARELDPTPLS